MRKIPRNYIVKICVGSIAMVVFFALGVPTKTYQSSSNSSSKGKSSGFIARSPSGHFTHKGSATNNTKKQETKKYTNPRMIYLGEPTDGLLDK